MTRTVALDARLEHQRSLSLVYVDHFGGRPIEEVLALRTTPTGTRPTPAANGSPRHIDGSYRFLDLAPGRYTIEPQARSGRWISWEPALTLDLPLAEPKLVRELWPTPATPDQPGLTLIRGKLAGSRPAGLVVEVRPAAAADWTGRYTKTDAWGEFIVPLREFIQPNSSGLLAMQIRVAGGARTVGGGEIRRRGQIISFSGSQFTIDPGCATRVTFALAGP